MAATRTGLAIGVMGDSESVEALVSVRDRAIAIKNAKAALAALAALVAARPELVQRKSLQTLVAGFAASRQAARVLAKRLDKVVDTPGEVERAVNLLKLAGENTPLRESLANRILARITAPSGKAEKALVRAARNAPEKGRQPSGA